MQTNKGFTIVELLIVIVVIAILAAITIITYRGIQNRAHETAVQSDLRGIGMQLMKEQALSDSGQPATANSAGLAGLVKVTKAAYRTNNINSGQFAYCRNNEKFALLARARTDRLFIWRSEDGSVKTGSHTGNLATLCGDAARGNIPTASDGYAAVWLIHHTSYSPDVWAPWVQ